MKLSQSSFQSTVQVVTLAMALLLWVAVSGQLSKHERQEMQKFLLEEHKKKLLQAMGLKHPPMLNGLSRRASTPFEQPLTESMFMNDGRPVSDPDQSVPRFKDLFFMESSNPFEDELPTGQQVSFVRFNFSRVNKTEDYVVRDADLFVRLPNVGPDGSRPVDQVFYVSVYLGDTLTVIDGKPVQNQTFRMSANRVDDQVSMPLVPSATKWIREHVGTSSGLLVKVEFKGKLTNRQAPFRRQFEAVNKSKGSFIKLKMEKMYAMGTAAIAEDVVSFNCHRGSLVVDFHKIGWTFMLSPKRYNAHHCWGDCSIIDPQFMSNQRQMGQLRRVSRNSSVQSGCRAVRTSDLLVAYDAGDQTRTSVLPNMIVNQCSCA
jgi:hypothetical protein